MARHKRFMREAIDEARLAQAKNEVPVGAIVVKDNHIIGRGHNLPITTHDPSAHAEIIAMRDAAKNIGNYRLTDATLYVTIEPCAMCASALVHARIKHLVFGTRDPKAGAVVSTLKLLENPAFNHKLSWEEGIAADSCGQLLKDFFAVRRK